jgi:hypothetical protein
MLHKCFLTQLWDLSFNILKKEQECHDKGVKVIILPIYIFMIEKNIKRKNVRWIRASFGI